LPRLPTSSASSRPFLSTIPPGGVLPHCTAVYCCAALHCTALLHTTALFY
jgi:hypothetical protein